MSTILNIYYSSRIFFHDTRWIKRNYPHVTDLYQSLKGIVRRWVRWYYKLGECVEPNNTVPHWASRRSEFCRVFSGWSTVLNCFHWTPNHAVELFTMTVLKSRTWPIWKYFMERLTGEAPYRYESSIIIFFQAEQRPAFQWILRKSENWHEL